MSVFFETTAEKKTDVICLGRIGVDLYAAESNTDLQEVTAFKKSVGGSPANIAVGLARFGRKSGFLGKVPQNKLGDYVINFLKREKVNTDGLSYCSEESAQISTAFTEQKPENCSVIIYRNNAADLHLSPKDIRSDYISSARCLLISGTALTRSPSREAVFQSVYEARKHKTLTVTDLDYRANSWESKETASLYLNLLAEKTDILIGNKEEFSIFLSTHLFPDLDSFIQNFISSGNKKIVIVKDGSAGGCAYHQGEMVSFPAYLVNVLKPFGAGDAFAAGVLHRMLAGDDLLSSLKFGSAAAAIVVSRIGCAEAMPTEKEVEDFLKTRRKPNFSPK